MAQSWRIVPVEPDARQMQAAQEYSGRNPDADVYRAMVLSATSQPSDEAINALCKLYAASGDIGEGWSHWQESNGDFRLQDVGAKDRRDADRSRMREFCERLRRT